MAGKERLVRSEDGSCGRKDHAMMGGDPCQWLRELVARTATVGTCPLRTAATRAQVYDVKCHPKHVSYISS